MNIADYAQLKVLEDQVRERVSTVVKALWRAREKGVPRWILAPFIWGAMRKASPTVKAIVWNIVRNVYRGDDG